MKRITTLEELYQAALDKKAITVTRWANGGARIPAAFMISMQGSSLIHLFRSGMFVYEPQPKPKKHKPMPALRRTPK